MPGKSKAEQLLDELLSRYEPALAEEFRRAVADIRRNVDLQRLIAALQAGDVAAAIDALNLDPAAFAKFEEKAREAFMAGGDGAVSLMPKTDGQGGRLVIRFSGRNPEAEKWLRERAAGLVTRVIDEQREVIRRHMAEAMAKGENPATAARRLVGALDAKTGERIGGVIGLTAQQEEAASRALAELQSGDPEQLRNYLTRARRDKRFDSTIKKAIEKGELIKAETVRKAATQYRQRLMLLRAELIGRHEAMSAMAASAHAAQLAAVESGQLQEQFITKIWESAGDSHVRHTHAILNGQKMPLRQKFRSVSGAELLYPHDPSAPADEVIGCRCWCRYDYDFIGELVANG